MVALGAAEGWDVKLHRLRGDPLVTRPQPWTTWAFTGFVVFAVAVAWPTVARIPATAAPWRVPWLVLALGFAVGRIVAIRF